MPLEYATPDTLPADTICRVLFIPNGEMLIGAVTGALKTLIDSWNWEQVGTITPDEAADAMTSMFDKFCFNQGVCHMIGEVILWSGENPPNTNCLVCDGSTYARTDYPDLYSVIDPVFHVDADNFNVPDLRNRVPVGSGDTYATGDTGGESTHTLDVSEMPAHSHTDTGHTHTAEVSTLIAAQTPVVPIPVALPGVGVTGSGSANLTSTGGDGAHNNLQPYIALNYYIVAL